MYERQEISQASIWKPEHIALLAGSAALVAFVLIVKARKRTVPRPSGRGRKRRKR